MVMSLDILKDFDGLERKNFLEVLSRMIFGPNFRQILKQIYSGTSG